MESLHEVCVWTFPFPPEGVTLREGSPNVYFTTECIDSIVFIPDTTFLHALIEEGVDSNGDSLISYAEVEGVISLDVSYRDISNLTGIEAFIKLDYLNCSNNALTILDVSNNSALDSLYCSANPLTSLDVSLSTGLVVLECNKTQIVSLDISENIKLKHIEIIDNPNLHEVCVWTTPFPPEGTFVYSKDSPNVNFTEQCGDLVDIKQGIAEELSVYPNPTNNFITIETEYPDHYSINITSLNGQLIHSEKMEGTSHQLDLSSFPKGFYLITIRSKDFVTSRKIIRL